MAKQPDIVAEARQRFKLAAEAEDAQRKAMLLAKEFRAGNQWPDAVRLQRQGAPAIQGVAAQPARPCLTIDRLSQPVRQVSNSVRAANFGIDVLPNGHGADDATADIYKGIIRRIQNQARGEAPIDWAADGAAECGIGWFRIRTDYIPLPAGYVGPEVKDQDIHLERIANNLTVYCDPAARKPTRGDARWMIVTEEIPKSEAKRKYGLDDDDLKSLDDFMATGDETNDGWVTEDTIRIGEYWRIVEDEQTVVQTEAGEFIPLPEGEKASDYAWSRVVSKPRVKMSIINAVKELQKSEWAGSKIPLVPVLGEELNVDGKAMLRGIIQEGMDAQRMVNYMYSAAIETVALAPKSPFIIAEGQLEGYKTMWQQANTANFAALVYKPTSLNGTPVPPPQRDNTEPAIQAMVLMLQKSEDAIKATTGFHDPSLGTDNPQEKSGRAILALQKQAELGASNYLDNVQRALVYAGELLVELIPKIYDRPGRILQILGIDDAPQQILVGQAFEQGQEGKPPQPKPELTKDQVRAKEIDTGLAKFYDLSEGQYSVTVSVSKSHTTRREEGANKLGELIAARPELLQIVGDLWARDLDIPGASELSDRLHKMLPPNLQENDGQPEIPPQVQQQMQQMQQMLDALSQELNAKNQVIETDQIKTQGQMQIAQIKEQAENARIQAELAKDERLEMAKLQLEMRKLEIQAETEAAKLGSAESLKRLEIEANLLHQHSERQLAEQELGAEQAQANMDRMSGQEDAERQRQHEGQQGERERQFQREEGAESRAFEADQAARERQQAAALAEQQAKAKQNGGVQK